MVGIWRKLTCDKNEAHAQYPKQRFKPPGLELLEPAAPHCFLLLDGGFSSLTGLNSSLLYKDKHNLCQLYAPTWNGKRPLWNPALMVIRNTPRPPPLLQRNRYSSVLFQPVRTMTMFWINEELRNLSRWKGSSTINFGCSLGGLKIKHWETRDCDRGAIRLETTKSQIWVFNQITSRS